MLLEKPGKSKFAPVVGGERRKTAAPTSESVTSSLPAPAVIHGSTDLPNVPGVNSTPTKTLEGDIADIQLVKRQKTIETVATRREQRQSSQIQPNSSFLADEPFPQNNSLLNPTSAASLIKFSPSERGKVTMTHFLKDPGTGTPMTTPLTLGQKGTSPLPSSRKVINIQTPPFIKESSKTVHAMTMTVVPQVRVVNGEIVVDEDTVARADAFPTGPTLPMDIVNESGRHLTSHSFVKTIGNNRWRREETELFYEALSMCGTDFALISLLFPKRSREQVKGKFKIEERNNPARVALYLRERKALDVAWLERAQAVSPPEAETTNKNNDHKPNHHTTNKQEESVPRVNQPDDLVHSTSQ